MERRLSHGGGHTGWSRAWIINHYARLWDGNTAYWHIEQLLGKSTYPNMFDRHPPFQIDGNFGGTAAMAEMLVQSGSRRVVLLPALPDVWKSGSARGLRIQGNAVIDLSWKEGVLENCRIPGRQRSGHLYSIRGDRFAAACGGWGERRVYGGGFPKGQLRINFA